MDRRAKYRAGLSTLYLPFYDALCAALPDRWQPYCGLRTFEEQTRLFNQGRSLPGAVVTKAQAGDSAHNYGCASDWCLWIDGKPVWPPASDPRWEEYVTAAEKIGLVPGGYFQDFPHNELHIDCSWRLIHGIYSKNGMRAAQEAIEERMVK